MNLMNRKTKENEMNTFIYTEEQLMARLKFFIGICLALTLTGIVFVVLYSLIFVTQPLNAISPIDQKFFELIIPIATFLTGTLSGIMLAGRDDKEARMKAIEAATRPTSGSPTPGAPGSLPTPRPFTPTMATSNPFGTTVPTFSVPVASESVAPIITGFGGKAAPPPAFEPER